jgi:hypothetical protein
MKKQYASDIFKGFRRILVSLIVVASVLPTVAQTPLNETVVYNRLMSRKTQEGYTEGTPWTNEDNKYVNSVVFNGYPAGCFTGVGCYGFMMDMMEYASNYEYPIRIVEGTYDNLPVIRVGDGVRLNNNGHSVVVLEVNGSVVTVAEGNFNKSVHWGRTIDLANSSNGFNYVATFWPEESNSITTGITDNINDSPTRDLRIYSLNGVLVKSISQTGLSVKTVLQELPKGFYVVKEATKTYKVYNGE